MIHTKNKMEIKVNNKRFIDLLQKVQNHGINGKNIKIGEVQMILRFSNISMCNLFSSFPNDEYIYKKYDDQPKSFSSDWWPWKAWRHHNFTWSHCSSCFIFSKYMMWKICKSMPILLHQSCFSLANYQSRNIPLIQHYQSYCLQLALSMTVDNSGFLSYVYWIGTRFIFSLFILNLALSPTCMMTCFILHYTAKMIIILTLK